MAGPSEDTRPHDAGLMRAALTLARRNLGITWPNPSVGCLIAQELSEGPRIIARGWTAAGGRPHAETEALAAAGGEARGATAYVSLEPCAHHGQTPPCAEALVASGVSRVVVATEDPDPRVQGKGIALLREAGIAVTTGIEQSLAREVNAGFFKRVRHGLPLVTLKLASTLDGRIATANHESRWITGERARREAHLLRAQYDAILVGSSTVIDDDPELTCRLPGLGDRSPVRIVADSRMRFPMTCKLAATARTTPTWLLMLPGQNAARRHALSDLGIDVIEVVAGAAGHIDLRLALELAAARGITRVLAEGGSELAASLLLADLVDQIVWFRSPNLIGATGLPAVAGLGIESLAQQLAFRRAGVRTLGDDVVETFVRPAA
jgi:diaminohydroxyphosphoribosylaminopyrimidine deaminase / 5-amino-6-(5-phosphoribosylamino)uracil reductase